MALLWEAAATREVKLLHRSLSYRQQLTGRVNWLNYLRCHDDIGWSFDNEDAWQVGINPGDHRGFLNSFYTGRFPGSFARGLPFQENPSTGDVRISGTMASLIGIEEALSSQNPLHLMMALKRLQMLYGVLCSVGGIPLLFLGEELGLLNDYRFQEDPLRAEDSRWAHRPAMDWEHCPEEALRREAPTDPLSLPVNALTVSSAREFLASDFRPLVYETLRALFGLRKEQPALSGTQLQLLPLTGPHLLCYLRHGEGQRLLVIANFSEHPQPLSSALFAVAGLGDPLFDLIAGCHSPLKELGEIAPYGIHWLVSAGAPPAC